MQKIIILVSLLLTLFTTCLSCKNDKDIASYYGLPHDLYNRYDSTLHYFKDDKFKLLSAVFLIKNLSDKFSYTSEHIDTLKIIKLNGKMNDFLLEDWNWFNYRTTKKIYDRNVITNQYLIKNISLAVDIWRTMPWHDKYSFNEFCEYILPYRIDDEPLEDWRQLYLNHYSYLLDSIQQTNDVVKAAEIVANHLKREGFDNHKDIELPHLGAKYLLHHRVGYCRENCDIATYAMRALGIPVTTDFYINSPSYNSSHYWSAIIDTTKLSIPFNYTESSPSRNYSLTRRIGKAYRKLFGDTIPKLVKSNINNIPDLFTNSHYIDVSQSYFPNVADITFSNIHQPSETELYLCIFNGKSFSPIDVSPICHNSATFSNVERDCIFFPCIIRNGELMPIDVPILTGTDSIIAFSPSKEYETALISRKYPNGKNVLFYQHTAGASLEISSNNVCFRSIYSFESPISCNYMYIPVCTPFRYLRFKSSQSNPLEIGELHCYSGDTILHPIKISGKHPLDSLQRRNLSLTQDDNWSTFFLGKKDDWLMFDLGANISVDKILYVPRNDDNDIRPGHCYELFYFSNDIKWVSLGIKKANGNSLVYSVPKNALLWIRCLNGGNEERPYFIKQTIQQFV